MVSHQKDFIRSLHDSFDGIFLNSRIKGGVGISGADRTAIHDDEIAKISLITIARDIWLGQMFQINM
jgi:hypothetical protein